MVACTVFIIVAVVLTAGLVAVTAFLVGSTLVAFTTALATGFAGGLTTGFATGLVATGTGAFTGGLQAVAASLDLTTAGFFAVGLGLPCGESNLSVGCSSRAPSSGELDFLADFFLIAGLSSPLFRFFALMSKNIGFSFRHPPPSPALGECEIWSCEKWKKREGVR